MSKGSLLGGALIVGLLFAACGRGDDETPPAAAPATSSSPAPTYSPGPSTEPASAAPAVTGETVTVTEVIDGDTFRTGDGREIRVLGIDSCEAATYGGRLATADAERQLTAGYGGPITLTRQAGVDTDGRGRHLRYVQFGTDREDLGEYMVAHDHTGVHQGRHDASPDYVDRLYARDTTYSANPPSGRECADPYPATGSGEGGWSYSSDGDDDVNMPDGALTGGYCARKWWC